jgi:hypothetical protein
MDVRNQITFDQCPDKKLWAVDFSAPLGEEDERTIALQMLNPDGSGVTLHPVKIAYSSRLLKKSSKS